METLGMTIFVLAWLAALASGFATWKFMSDARDLIRQEGGNGLSLVPETPPIDVRRLLGAAVIPARKANMWSMIVIAFGLLGLWGLLLVDPLNRGLVIGVGFSTMIAIPLAIHTYRMSWPPEPNDGAKPQANA
jgi:hypothetical protein